MPMSKKSKLILLVVVAAFVVIIAAKPFIKSNTTQSLNGGIDQNSDYAQALADAKAKGEPVFLEFFGNT